MNNEKSKGNKKKTSFVSFTIIFLGLLFIFTLNSNDTAAIIKTTFQTCGDGDSSTDENDYFFIYGELNCSNSHGSFTDFSSTSDFYEVSVDPTAIFQSGPLFSYFGEADVGDVQAFRRSGLTANIIPEGVCMDLQIAFLGELSAGALHVGYAGVGQADGRTCGTGPPAGSVCVTTTNGGGGELSLWTAGAFTDTTTIPVIGQRMNLTMCYNSSSAHLYQNNSDSGIVIVNALTLVDTTNFTGEVSQGGVNDPFINVTYVAVYNKTGAPTAQSTTPPAFSNNLTNNTQPRIGDDVSFNITGTDVDGISGYIFSWDNGTGTFQNDSFVDITDFNFKIANVTANKTIEVVAGTDIQYQWYMNDTLGNMGVSGIARVQVSGTSAPNITTNANNFFNASNVTIIGSNASQAQLINITFTDDIGLFGFDIVIKNNRTRVTVFNTTNITLTGVIQTFSAIVNVSGTQDYYVVNVTSKDAHTEFDIADFKIKKGFNYLEYDDNIRITAEGAIWSNSKKLRDRHTFEFTYLPFLGPKTKIYYLESNSRLYYIQDSHYKGHFVDYQNNKWIDFEGLEGNPIITKISDTKWKIEFTSSKSKVIFNSIGSLNEKSEFYLYYLSNPALKWLLPETNTTTYFGSSFSVSLNVTGDGRNLSKIRLFNSTGDLQQEANVTNVGNGTYFYNATFSGLVDSIYQVNATHFDVVGENVSIHSLTFNSIQLTDCSVGARAINFTFLDEKNSSRIRSTATGTFNYNGTSPTETLTRSIINQDNFSVCVTPPGETIEGDYDVVYSATNYPQRQLIVDAITFNNNTQIKNLFLLNVNDGLFATFRIIDSFQNPLTGVSAKFRKASDSDIINSKLTDDSGTVSFFVDPDTSYVFTFAKSGFKTASFTLTITDTETRTISLESEVSEQVTSFSTAVDYFFLPTNEVLNNNTNITFSFNLTSRHFNLTGCTFKLSNASNLLASTTCFFNGSQSNASLLFNTGNQTIITAQASYLINLTNTTVSHAYRVVHTFEGSGSLKNFLDSVSTFSEAAFDDFDRFLIAVLIILLFVGTLSLRSTEFREPEILIPMVWIGVAFFSFIGWMEIPLQTIPNIKGLPDGWLNQWIVFILTSLTGGGYLLNKHTK